MANGVEGARADARGDTVVESAGGPRAWFRSIDGLLALAVLGAAVPVIVAAAARVAEHWQPSDDEAAIARISHDVLSTNTPLLGMPSTISAGVKVTGGGTAHHLGPMLFWWFAIPDLIGRSSPNALIVAIAALNIACIAAVAWVVRRHAGPASAIAAMVAISVMLVELGRDVTVQIWNPYAALLPFLLFLVLAWAFASGDRIALPAAAVVGSFVIQCHVLYVIPVIAVTVVSLVALVLYDRRTKAAHEATDPWRRTRRRSFIATGALLAVCWWTAAWDQSFHHGGNATRLWNSLSRSSQLPLGFGIASRYVMRVVAIPPLFARNLASQASSTALIRPVGVGILLGAILVLLVLAGGAAALRTSSPTYARLGMVALVALASAWYVLARLPIELGGPTVYRLRFLWIVSVFAWIALVVQTGHAIARRAEVRTAIARDGVRRALAVAVTVAIVACGVTASLRRSAAYAVASDDTRIVTPLTHQVRGALPDRGPYLLTLGGTRAFISVGFGVMWDLVRHGYDIRVLAGDPYLGAHHGVPRRAHMRRLFVVSGNDRTKAPTGAHRVARLDSAPELPRTVARLRQQVIAALDRTPPRLTASGHDLLVHSHARALVRTLRTIAATTPDWDPLLRRPTLAVLGEAKLIEAPAAELRLFVRYDTLLDRSLDSVFSVYVVPAPS